ARALADDRLYPRNVPAQAANLLQALRLAHVELKLQLEELVGEFAFLMLQLFFRQIPDLVCFHKFLNRAHRTSDSRFSATRFRASPAWSAGPVCAKPTALLRSRPASSRLPSQTEFSPVSRRRPSDRERPCPYPYGFRPAFW